MIWMFAEKVWTAAKCVTCEGGGPLLKALLSLRTQDYGGWRNTSAGMMREDPRNHSTWEHTCWLHNSSPNFQGKLLSEKLSGFLLLFFLATLFSLTFE